MVSIVDDHLADGLNIGRQSEGIVDLLQRRGMDNESVNFDLLRRIGVGDLGHISQLVHHLDAPIGGDVGVEPSCSSMRLVKEQRVTMIGPRGAAAIGAYGDGSRAGMGECRQPHEWSFRDIVSPDACPHRSPTS